MEKLLSIASPRQLALPLGILTIIVLMVVPIPAFMLDIFFVFNIALSVAVLMASMNAAKPLDFSSFPTVLLFATLLRLALNVASTRVVLVHGHEGSAAAGHVIEAFGDDLTFDIILTDQDVVKLSVIGVGMRSYAGAAQKMFETLADKRINIHVISTSEIKISVLIAEEYTELALRALHTAYQLDAS